MFGGAQEKVVQGHGAKTVAVKVVADQLVFAPILNPLLMTVLHATRLARSRVLPLARALPYVCCVLCGAVRSDGRRRLVQ